MQSKEQYLNLYRECRELITRHSSDVMNAQRDAAYAELQRMGLPTKRDEDYKYTDVEAAKGHSLEVTDKKAPTCTEKGCAEYWRCTGCGCGC